MSTFHFEQFLLGFIFGLCSLLFSRMNVYDIYVHKKTKKKAEMKNEKKNYERCKCKVINYFVLFNIESGPLLGTLWYQYKIQITFIFVPFRFRSVWLKSHCLYHLTIIDTFFFFFFIFFFHRPVCLTNYLMMVCVSNSSRPLRCTHTHTHIDWQQNIRKRKNTTKWDGKMETQRRTMKSDW